MEAINKVVGLVPAAGFAKRISSLDCSKEIYPIRHSETELKVVSSYLLDSFRVAGISEAYVVLRAGKWDIPEYFKNEAVSGLNLAFIVTEPTKGVPQTINKAYSFISRYKIAFGFPDILTQSQNDFDVLLDKQEITDAELVLGLYKATKPNKVDMVSFDNSMSIDNIYIKPAKTDLTYTWINAVWTPVFTRFINKYVTDFGKSIPTKDNDLELYLGDVIRAAIHSGLKTTYVKFKSGTYVDIGTPEELEKINDNEWFKTFYFDR